MAPARTPGGIQAGGKRFKSMKFTVYVLKDQNSRFYKGVTGNLSRRLAEHKSRGTKTTRHMTNPEVVYTETFNSFAEARKREVYLKTAAGRRFLKKILGL